MRDAKRDLAACEAATPPPWTTKPSGETINGFSCDVVIAATAGGKKSMLNPREAHSHTQTSSSSPWPVKPCPTGSTGR